ncbi:MAG: T9SS type A sorting domain-containing protein [Bacteroidota bacterium]
MKTPHYFLIALLLIVLSCESTESHSPFVKTEETEKEPNDWMFRQRAFPSGTIDEKAYRKALVIRDKQRAEQRANQQAKDLTTAEWVFDGPLNIGGRVTDVEVIPGSPEVILLGAASGGIFRTTDEGASWEAVFDDMPTLAIGDMAIAPSNPQTVYVGTGEPNAGGGSLTYDGLGIFKSEDGGQSWEAKGLDDVGSVGRVVVDPSNEDRLYVAAMGTLFANNEERGIYRSLDGGDNWEQVLFLSDSTGGIDLAIHPDEPMTIYAAMWERVRRPDRRSYTGPTSGIYKSLDGGDTWEELGGGLPSIPFSKGRISLAIAPSNPNHVYAGYVDDNGTLSNMMQSSNAGLSWSNMSTNGLGTVPFDWWFNRLVVSPDNEEELYYIGFQLNRYNAQNQSWDLRFANVHVDQHTLWVDPANPNRMLLGNDGGIYYSTDRGVTNTKWNNLPITQFYTCEVDFQQPDRRYGGTQDNGTNRTLTGNTDDWQFIYGGDGFRVLVDPTDNSFVYATSQYGNIGRSTNGGNSFTGATNGLTGPRNWSTPYLIDPVTPQRLYVGTDAVHRSDNRAASWTRISPNLADDAFGSNGLVYGTITALDVAALDNQVIWAGTDNGNVWVTTNGGDSWNKVSAGLPMRWVTSICADPNDPATAYLTYSGFRYGTSMSHIYKTSDYGTNWQDINGDLPDIPVNDIQINAASSQLFLATDIGVYFSEDDGASWQVLGTGLPPVVVTDLRLHTPTETLVAGTYGRSMWSINVGEEVNVMEPSRLALDWKIFPNPLQDQATIQANIPTAAYYQVILYNQLGQKLRTIFAGNLTKGEVSLPLKRQGLMSGSYVVSWQQGDQVSSQLIEVY